MTIVSLLTPSSDAPPPDFRPGKGRLRVLSVGLSVCTVVAAVAYLVLPGIWQWRTANPIHVHDQIAAPVPVQDPALLARLRAVPDLPAGAAPIVLTYHDISDEPGYYTVTPATFAAQMQLLHDAGYTTLTAAQFTDWLHGAPLPRRSVLVTLDDGVEGIWRAADPILARLGQHAIAFVITGFVGTRQSYYANWPELTAMAASGRWDIESHSHVGHVRFTINDRNEQGPFLTNRHYLAAEHRVETDGEYRSRVANDLRRSVEEISEHKLPAPRLFAYPFSENEGEPILTTTLAGIVHSLFDAAMLDETGAAVTTPADVRAGRIRRVDVTADVNLAQWVNQIERSTPLLPGQSNPFNDRQGWTGASGKPEELNVADGMATIDPGAGGWAGLLYAKARTVQWQNYKVDAVLGGFRRPGDGSTTGLRVLADTPQQVQVTVFSGGFEVRQGEGGDQRMVAHGTLPAAPSYPVRMQTRPGDVVVTVCGRDVAHVSLSDVADGPPAGGIEMTGQREGQTGPVPWVKDLTVSEN